MVVAYTPWGGGAFWGSARPITRGREAHRAAEFAAAPFLSPLLPQSQQLLPFGNMSRGAPLTLTSLLAPLDKAGFERLDKRLTVPEQVPPYGQGKVLNRYWDILPCPRTSVKLRCLNGDQSTQYINANYIRGSSHTPTGKPNPREYIAAQGPLPATVDAFVRMIFEQQCSAVVMTTRLVEGQKVKCERYWPSKAGFAQRCVSVVDVALDLAAAPQMPPPPSTLLMPHLQAHYTCPHLQAHCTWSRPHPELIHIDNLHSPILSLTLPWSYLLISIPGMAISLWDCCASRTNATTSAAHCH